MFKLTKKSGLKNRLFAVGILCGWLISGQALAQVDSGQTAKANVKPATKASALQNKYQEELDKWMLQAYEGDRDAQFKVGVLFTNDQFDSADFEQAVYWYKQAARQGHALAQYNLGHQYLTGVGIKRSETEAMRWWLKAAQQDHPLAQFNVGRGYYLGIGLLEDHSQSQYWFKRAAQNQEPKSIEILEQLGWAKPGEYTITNKTSKQPEAEPAAEKQFAGKESSADRDSSANKKPSSGKAASSNDSSKTSQVAAASKSNEAAKNQAVAQELGVQTNPIAVYTNPAKRSVLIAILDFRDNLEVVSRSPEWTVVTNKKGFPVWVNKGFISANGDSGVITGDAVNARSVPLIANGTIVGQLNKGEKVTVLDKQNDWYRIMSPIRFKAWVKTDDFERRKSTNSATAEAATIKAAPVVNTAKKNTNSTAKGIVNDNDWLFNQPVDGYTLQLASFDDPEKISNFMTRPKFDNNPDLHRFTSKSKDIEWTYFLFGAFESNEAAKIKRDEIGQKRAWVRSFGKLQQNRCLAWKKQIPTPKELNKYCS